MKPKRFLSVFRAALLIGSLLMAGVGLASYASLSSLISSSNQRDLADKNLALLEEFFFALIRVDAMLQNYTVSGATSDLNAFQEARTQSRKNRLKFQAAKNLPEQASLDAIFTERRVLDEKVVEARKNIGFEAALDVINSGEFRSLREQGNSLLESIRARQLSAVIGNEASATKSASNVQQLIIVFALLFSSLLVWFFYLIKHYEKTGQRLNAQLRESAALSRSITDGMVEGVITMDEASIVLELNQSVLRLFSYDKKEQLLGRHFSKLLPRQIGQPSHPFFSLLVDISESFKLVNHELTCQRQDGSEFLAAISMSQVLMNDLPIRTVLIQDITERRTTSNALRSREFLLRKVTDTVPALIAYLDKDAIFRFHNKAYEELLALSFDQINGRLLSEVLGKKAYATVDKKVNEVLQGYVVRYERVQLDAHGDFRTYAVEYFPRYVDDAKDGEVVGFFSMGTDITERKRIDRMKTEFISTVSHELRTPLTSIRGSLGLIAGGVAGELPAAMKNLVQIAKNNCDRLIRLINDILDSEKIESGKMQMNLQVLDLRRLIDQVLAQTEGFALQHGVKFLFNADEKPFFCQVDTDRLSQVMINLLSNAVKFSRAGDVVEVKLSHHQYGLRLEVVDQGSGIPEQFHQLIFKKFSQADSSDSRQKGGTGLGLNISRSIIEKMHGKIGFTSTVDVGSTFFIELPEWHAPKTALQRTLHKLKTSRPNADL